MPTTATQPFEGRHLPGEVILLCGRWYLRFRPVADATALIVSASYRNVSRDVCSAPSQRTDPCYLAAAG